jgi:hypothetical protein
MISPLEQHCFEDWARHLSEEPRESKLWHSKQRFQVAKNETELSLVSLLCRDKKVSAQEQESHCHQHYRVMDERQ